MITGVRGGIHLKDLAPDRFMISCPMSFVAFCPMKDCEDCASHSNPPASSKDISSTVIGLDLGASGAPQPISAIDAANGKEENKHNLRIIINSILQRFARRNGLIRSGFT